MKSALCCFSKAERKSKLMFYAFLFLVRFPEALLISPSNPPAKSLSEKQKKKQT